MTVVGVSAVCSAPVGGQQGLRRGALRWAGLADAATEGVVGAEEAGGLKGAAGLMPLLLVAQRAQRCGRERLHVCWRNLLACCGTCWFVAPQAGSASYGWVGISYTSWGACACGCVAVRVMLSMERPSCGERCQGPAHCAAALGRHNEWSVYHS